jgi:hypothetical protein
MWRVWGNCRRSCAAVEIATVTRIPAAIFILVAEDKDYMSSHWTAYDSGLESPNFQATGWDGSPIFKPTVDMYRSQTAQG